MSLNKIINRMEQTVKEGCKEGDMLFMIRVGDTITVRDNSGIVDMPDDTLDLVEELMEEVFDKAKSK